MDVFTTIIASFKSGVIGDGSSYWKLFRFSLSYFAVLIFATPLLNGTRGGVVYMTNICMTEHLFAIYNHA